ncbi:MAG: hypothetical protein IKT32_01210 [Clostridia bacterium]|nr:hypothetical protein [Clostridia bacterium]
MFGDALRRSISRLKNASLKKNDANTFWVILRDIAVEDIKGVYPSKVDSDTAIGVYFEILSENEDKFPLYYSEKLPSNNQERYRVLNRNMWSSNAFHPDGLANQIGIIAYCEMNESKKGDRIVYQGSGI